VLVEVHPRRGKVKVGLSVPKCAIGDIDDACQRLGLAGFQDNFSFIKVARMANDPLTILPGPDCPVPG
jgi:hypothetical protein